MQLEVGVELLLLQRVGGGDQRFNVLGNLLDTTGISPVSKSAANSSSFKQRMRRSRCLSSSALTSVAVRLDPFIFISSSLLAEKQDDADRKRSQDGG